MHPKYVNSCDTRHRKQNRFNSHSLRPQVLRDATENPGIVESLRERGDLEGRQEVRIRSRKKSRAARHESACFLFTTARFPSKVSRSLPPQHVARASATTAGMHGVNNQPRLRHASLFWIRTVRLAQMSACRFISNRLP